jgi:iron complex outermembrane receptor protein
LRYDITPQIEAYGNISELVEAPQIISYAQSANFTANGVSNSYYNGFVTAPTGGFTFNEANLKPQVGTNYEIGVKGQYGRFKWDIDYYNEQLHDELLTIYALLPNVNPAYPNGISYTENARPTVHEGVEASVDTELWKEGDHTVSLRQAYTWNNFHFAHENLAAGFGVLPGLPEDFYQGALNYKHKSGFYAGLSVESSLVRYPVDYFNKTFAPSYTLVGANIGYAPTGQKWRIFIDAENIGNTKYASFSSATGLATASSAVFTAGEGRSITGGLTYAF